MVYVCECLWKSVRIALASVFHCLRDTGVCLYLYYLLHNKFVTFVRGCLVVKQVIADYMKNDGTHLQGLDNIIEIPCLKTFQYIIAEISQRNWFSSAINLLFRSMMSCLEQLLLGKICLYLVLSVSRKKDCRFNRFFRHITIISLY